MRTAPGLTNERGCDAQWHYEGKWARTGRDRERAVSAEVGQLDHPPCEEGTWDTYDAQDDLLHVDVSENYASVV